MLRAASLSLAAIVVSAPLADAPAHAQTPPQVGDSVPALELTDLDGERRILPEGGGAAPRVLVFFRGVW